MAPAVFLAAASNWTSGACCRDLSKPCLCFLQGMQNHSGDQGRHGGYTQGGACHQRLNVCSEAMVADTSQCSSACSGGRRGIFQASQRQRPAAAVSCAAVRGESATPWVASTGDAAGNMSCQCTGAGCKLVWPRFDFG